MAGRTPRFKLNTFGSGTSGAIGDDGFKFTGLDRLTIDRLLAQVEDHDYRFHPGAVSSLAAPTAALVEDEAGTLRGGVTYYYRFSVVNGQGLETMASEEVSVSTPSPLPTPGPLGLAASEEVGTLPPGMYYYAVTAIRGVDETPLGPPVLVSLLEGETAVEVTFPALGAAESFRLWRMHSTESGFTKIGVFSTSTTVDAGAVPANPCAGTAGNRPPQANAGLHVYAVRVTLPESVDLSEARSWRLYRTIYPGNYPATSLVHEVVERESEWDDSSPLMASWVDLGRTLTSGQPMVGADLNMRLRPFSFHRSSELPAAAGWPEGYPMLVGNSLFAKLQGEWRMVAGGSGGGDSSNILTAPDGGRWALSVANDGTVSTVSTSIPGPPAAVQNVQEVV